MILVSIFSVIKLFLLVTKLHLLPDYVLFSRLYEFINKLYLCLFVNYIFACKLCMCLLAKQAASLLPNYVF